VGWRLYVETVIYWPPVADALDPGEAAAASEDTVAP
jgi:hypothetical protein